MNVSLTPELERFVASKVKTGLYQTASEVVREALRTLRAHDENERKRKSLLADLDRGIDELNRSEGKTVRATELLSRIRNPRRKAK